jgi:catechol 2,3-dioxygenase-like lactoylglutathione lyase family enzyme
MIGRMHHIAIDCPDPRALAPFYTELTGLPVVWDDADWTVIAADRTSSGIAFQRAPDLRAPDWPDPRRPQQMHLDIMVDDIATAVARITELGARALSVDGSGHGVYADPVGHPFCLIPRPAWAPPIGG